MSEPTPSHADPERHQAAGAPAPEGLAGLGPYASRYEPYLTPDPAHWPRPPSLIGVLLHAGQAMPSPTQVVERLEGSGIVVLGSVVDDGSGHEGGGQDGSTAQPRWRLSARLDVGGIEATYSLLPMPSPMSEVPAVSYRSFDERQRGNVTLSAWSIAVSTVFDDDSLGSYHRQLRVLAAIEPESAGIFDGASESFSTGAWLQRTAASLIPPPASAMWRIDLVSDQHCEQCAEDAQDGAARQPVHDDQPIAWLHTHGLARCGLPEIEVLGVPAPAARWFGGLVNAVASHYLRRGLPLPGEVMSIGHGIDVVWEPWERAAALAVPPHKAGGQVEREASHTHPAAAVYATDPQTGVRLSMDTLASLLAHEQVFFVHPAETTRMELQSRSELRRFTRFLDDYSGEDGWQFAVQCGIPENVDPYELDVDLREENDDPIDELELAELAVPVNRGGELTSISAAGQWLDAAALIVDDRRREHLWFEPTTMDPSWGTMVGELQNEPYFVDLEVDRMYALPLAWVTSFVVGSPFGTFGPDDLADLELRLPPEMVPRMPLN